MLLIAGVAEAFSANLVGTASMVRVDGADDQVKIDLGNGNFVQFNSGEAASQDVWDNLTLYAQRNKKVKVTVKDGLIVAATTPPRVLPPQPVPEKVEPAATDPAGKSPA